MSDRILHLHAIDGHAVGIFDQHDSIVAEVNGHAGMTEDDARRVVACWNACCGIPLGYLEKSSANRDMMTLEAARANARSLGMELARYIRENDRLKAALEAVAEAGRMSDQSRAKYCAQIAITALNQPGVNQ